MVDVDKTSTAAGSALSRPPARPAGSRRLRLAHRDRRPGRRARLPVHLQRRLERHLHGHRHPQDQDRGPGQRDRRPARRATSAPVPRQHRADQRREQLRVLRRRQRHLDVQVRHDDRPGRRGRHREPDAAVVASPMTGVSIGHSGDVLLRRQDGRLRLGAGRRHLAAVPGRRARSSTARCSSSNTETGEPGRARLLHPRLQSQPGELHLAQLQHRADQGRQHPRVGQLPGRHQRDRLQEPAAPTVVAYADPTPLPEDHPTARGDPDGGDWSTYWYNGKIYESDIYRGVMVWDLDNAFTNRAKTVDGLQPADADRRLRGRQREADGHHRGADRGRQVPAGLAAARRASPAPTRASASSPAPAPSPTAPTSTRRKIGYQTYTVTAVDNAGNRRRRRSSTWSTHRAVHDPGRDRAGDAGAGAGRGGHVRRVHAGRRARVHGEPRPPT